MISHPGQNTLAFSGGGKNISYSAIFTFLLLQEPLVFSVCLPVVLSVVQNFV